MAFTVLGDGCSVGVRWMDLTTVGGFGLMVIESWWGIGVSRMGLTAVWVIGSMEIKSGFNLTTREKGKLFVSLCKRKHPIRALGQFEDGRGGERGGTILPNSDGDPNNVVVIGGKKIRN